jgi:hypothetical protein
MCLRRVGKASRGLTVNGGCISQNPVSRHTSIARPTTSARGLPTWKHELVLVDHSQFHRSLLLECLLRKLVNDTPAQRSIDACPFDQIFLDSIWFLRCREAKVSGNGTENMVNG